MGRIPLLLLKTKSAPADGYEDFFSTASGGSYHPVFVPVLEHRFKHDVLDHVQHCVTAGSFTQTPPSEASPYGALIFTSQRAVEAFTKVIENIRRENGHLLDTLLPDSTPFYVVGPATARGLRALRLRCPILGEETGNGDALASMIFEHYNSLYHGQEKPPILFLVGDKRRDIIPRTLQAEHLMPERRSRVDELVVYETGEMQSFKADFSAIWGENEKSGAEQQWVVVFSPTGCRAMLESLGLLDEKTGKVRPAATPRRVLIATIGPTTRDYLVNEFGFSPDVCAKKPSPEGIADAIQSFAGAGE